MVFVVPSMTTYPPSIANCVIHPCSDSLLDSFQLKIARSVDWMDAYSFGRVLVEILHLV